MVMVLSPWAAGEKRCATTSVRRSLQVPLGDRLGEHIAVLDKLINFLLCRPLINHFSYDELRLEDHGAGGAARDGLELRQNLLKEQEVLKLTLDILRELERLCAAAKVAARGRKRRAAGMSDLERWEDVRKKVSTPRCARGLEKK